MPRHDRMKRRNDLELQEASQKCRKLTDMLCLKSPIATTSISETSTSKVGSADSNITKAPTIDINTESLSNLSKTTTASDIDDKSVTDHHASPSQQRHEVSPMSAKSPSAFNFNKGSTTSCQERSSLPLVKTDEQQRSSSERTNTEERMLSLGALPHQPHGFIFPQRSFGRKKYRFQSSWFRKWPWIHYLEDNDTVLCHICAQAKAMELPSTEKGDPSFIETGFSGWKKATEMGKGFTKHEMSVYHKSSTSMVTRTQATKDISGQLSSQYEVEKMVRRGNLLKILSSVRFLARQGLPLRGQGDGSNSNLNQLLALRGQDDPVFRQWTERKSERKYTSNEIQQEMLKLMALHILRNVAANIRSATYFTIMADETTDISNREQVVICLRWVDDDLVPHEDFIGLHKVDTIDAVTIKNVILDVLLRLNLSMQKCRGQCYDGCSTIMNGWK